MTASSRWIVAVSALAIGLTAFTQPEASAQEWPSRPVRIVSAYSAGGAADLVSRLVAMELSDAFRQQFYVETRAGASGIIAVKTVMNSPPDGYNFVVTTSTLLVLIPASNPAVGYDPVRDLTNIAYIAGTPIVFSVNAKSGIKSLKELVAFAKKSDKPLLYSSSGIGTSGHLVAEVFAKEAGIKIEHVPYKGGSQGLTDLIGGQIAFSSQTLPSTLAYMGNTLTAIAQSGKSRLAEFPDLATLKEEGYDIVSTTWYSLAGPPNLPDEIVRKVNAAVVAGMSTHRAMERLRQFGLTSEPMSVEEVNQFIRDETARWKPVAQALGQPSN